MSEEKKIAWWNLRDGLDERMRLVLESMETMLVEGGVGSAMLGRPMSMSMVEGVEKLMARLMVWRSDDEVEDEEDDEWEERVRSLLWSSDTMTEEELSSRLLSLLTGTMTTTSAAAAEAAELASTIAAEISVLLLNALIETCSSDSLDSQQYTALCEQHAINCVVNKATKKKSSTSTTTNIPTEQQQQQQQQTTVALATSMRSTGQKTGIGSLNRHPVIFLLDHYLSRYPWESIKFLRRHPISRMPSLCSISRAYLQQEEQQEEEEQHEEEEQEEGMVVDSLVTSARLLDVGDSRTSFVINPSGDLTRTERTFRESLVSLAESGVSWGGTFGVETRPKLDEYVEQLRESNMMV